MEHKKESANNTNESYANHSLLKAVLAVVVVAGLAIYFYGGGLQQNANVEMQNISDKVASDAVDQYNMAKRQGDKTQICVQAGFVSAAYLQAKDETNYTKWKSVEKSDCDYMMN